MNTNTKSLVPKCRYKIVVLFLMVFCQNANAQVKKTNKNVDSLEKVDSSAAEKGEAIISGSSTRIDFSEASIDGKMKIPEGFFLKGRNQSELSQMVQLRSNFRSELRNSQSAMKAYIK
jgi:hypothetical protein